MAQIELTKFEIENLIDFLDCEFIPFIQKSEEDNMRYLICMCDVYKKLEEARERERR